MKKLIVASNNQGKVQEIKDLLSPFCQEISSLKDINLNIQVDEDGDTFQANAIKKASEIMKITNLPVLADDSGLEVDALNGRPGVYSARFAGENATDEENNTKLLRQMKEVKEENRSASFICVMALCFPDGRILTTEGSCRGRIGFEEKGKNGFGYDPLFFLPEWDMTFAEISLETKNKISHRAKALINMMTALKQMEED